MHPDRIDLTLGIPVFLLPATARSVARTVPIPKWAILLVSDERRIAVADGRATWSIGYKKWKTQTDDVQSAGLMTIKAILDHAGLRFDGTVTPSSIRNTRALEVYAEHGSQDDGQTSLAAHQPGLVGVERDFGVLRCRSSPQRKVHSPVGQ